MIMIGVSIIIGIILIATIAYLFKEKLDEQNLEVAEELLESVENELFLATKVEPGYMRDFEIPQTLNNEEYNISVVGGDLILSYKEIDFLGILPNISGNITKGPNTIRNINGKVCLNLETC